QLSHDGHADIASMLIGREHLKINDCKPSSELEGIIASRLNKSVNIQNQLQQTPADRQKLYPIPKFLKKGHTSPFISTYKTNYITTHKEACTYSAFSTDGCYLATGSADCSIKLIDAFRVMSKSDVVSTESHSYDFHPVIRTICEHTSPIIVMIKVCRVGIYTLFPTNLENISNFFHTIGWLLRLIRLGDKPTLSKMRIVLLKSQPICDKLPQRYVTKYKKYRELGGYLYDCLKGANCDKI
ncbi:MAG: cleavage stimulation factor, 3' pre-RNA, subunit 1, partial [Paramarteilia canceri]